MLEGTIYLLIGILFGLVLREAWEIRPKGGDDD